MRKGNATIFASIFVMALVAASVSLGTMAWFSDTEEAGIGQIKTGTKDLKIALGSRDTRTTAWADSLSIPGPQNWDDEDTFTFVIWFKNVGTAGALYLYREYGGYYDDVDGANFLDAVEIVSMYEFYIGSWDTTNWVMGSSDGSTWSDWGWWYTGSHVNYEHCLTLRELLDMKTDKYDEKCYNYASVSGDPKLPTADYLPPGGVVKAEYTIKLMGSATTNALQGKQFGFTITAHMTDENIHTYPGPVT